MDSSRCSTSAGRSHSTEHDRSSLSSQHNVPGQTPTSTSSLSYVIPTSNKSHKDKGRTREQTVTSVSPWTRGGQEGCQGSEASRGRGPPGPRAHPQQDARLSCISSIVPFSSSDRVPLWTGGTGEKPATPAHLVVPRCYPLAPAPAVILPRAWGGPVLVMAQYNGGGPAAWPLGFCSALFFPCVNGEGCVLAA